MKKVKQIIFLLTVLAMFLIAGNMDCGEISFGAAAVLSVLNFILMAWSGFSSGLLNGACKIKGYPQEKIIILNRNVRNISQEKRQKLLEMARVMFKEDFDK